MEKFEILVQGVNQDIQQNVKNSMQKYFNQLEEIKTLVYSVKVSDVNDTEGMKIAKDLQRKVKKVRTSTENARKSIKKEYLDTGRMIDSVAGSIKDEATKMELYLDQQARYAEIIENERLNKLETERKEQLSAYIEDVSFYDLKNMSTVQWEQTLKGAELQYKADQQRRLQEEKERLEREQAEAEAKKVALQRQKELEAENNRLKAEAERLKAKAEQERAAYRAKITFNNVSSPETSKHTTEPVKTLKRADFNSDKELILQWIKDWQLPEMDTADMSEEYQLVISDIWLKFIKMKKWAGKLVDSI